jgi:2-keto-4-pentenoate hydratase
MQTFAETVTPRRGTPASVDYDESSHVTEAALPAGVLVCQGTADNAVKVPTSAAEVAACKGVVLYNALMPAPGDDATTNDFAAARAVSVMNSGVIWAVCEDAIAAGAAVFCRHTANGGGKTQLGAVRSDNDGGGATVASLPNCRAVSASTGAGVVKLRVNLPYATA